jgi:hypothetical protein
MVLKTTNDDGDGDDTKIAVDVAVAVAIDHSPPVKLHELTPPRITIKCHAACGMMVRIYRVEPSTAIGAYKYCPQCGSQNVSAYMSADDNHWEALARDYDLPIQLLQQLYKLWVPSKHYRFADFVHELRAEIAAGQIPAIVQAKQQAQQAKARATDNVPPMPKLTIPGR